MGTLVKVSLDNNKKYDMRCTNYLISFKNYFRGNELLKQWAYDEFSSFEDVREFSEEWMSRVPEGMVYENNKPKELVTMAYTSEPEINSASYDHYFTIKLKNENKGLIKWIEKQVHDKLKSINDLEIQATGKPLFVQEVYDFTELKMAVEIANSKLSLNDRKYPQKHGKTMNFWQKLLKVIQILLG
jgi:hypothetical protein